MRTQKATASCEATLAFFCQSSSGSGALQQTATIQDLTALANATFFVEEIVAHINSIIADMSGIFAVNADENVAPMQRGIYTLSGQKLNAAPEKGFYIENGKKYFAK